MSRKIIFIVTLLALIGIIDSTYLTFEHLSGRIPPCSKSFVFIDCGQVLQSKYSEVFGIPLAFLGMLYYSVILGSIALVISKKDFFKFVLIVATFTGALFSVYFVFLQIAVIGAICLYCMVSAVTSFLLVIIIHLFFSSERKRLTIAVATIAYKHILKPIYFRSDPEKIHVSNVWLGEMLGKLPLVKGITKYLFVQAQPSLIQLVNGIRFAFPVGLAAGFDYNAQLTQILPSLGFGFGTVGTITNGAYEGNSRPMLGRLLKSRSLMVNKGFKNFGASTIIGKLTGQTFVYPVGISIGKTNTLALKTRKDSIKDIIEAFRKFDSSTINHSYYELNISCPNLYGNITFYPPKNLDELLTAVDSLKLKRPIFIKMPIEKSDKEVLAMLKIISQHKITGVIFGNLQKDRSHPLLVKEEVAQFDQGNFSGKPTFERSNELISLTYKKYGKRFVIIGCGGIFSAEDAYEKIKRGATLVQLITGMIFEGPQLIADINMRLPALLKKDGYTHISEAVGIKN